MTVKLKLSRASAPAFEVELGPVLATSRHSVLQEAKRTAPQPGESQVLVVKRGEAPADFGRLDLEQLACERLDHPGLATYHGAVRTPELGTVLAFERLGENALVLLNSRGVRPRFRDPLTRYYPLPPARALELAFDVLLALEHVHSRGFVHGGVTLANVRTRTSTRATEGRDVLHDVAGGAFEGVLAGLGGARSLDFLEGLAKGIDPELGPLPDAIHAPPEALLGARPLYSPAMDVYSWGIVFATLLTGRAPYEHVRSTQELRDGAVVLALKAAEATGKLVPFPLDSLDAIPLHDSPFSGPVAETWPVFRGGVEHALVLATRRDAAARPTAGELRHFFEEELRLRPSLASGPRPWSQHLFQTARGSNRLLAPAPVASVRLAEEADQVVFEERWEAADAPAGVRTEAGHFDGSLVAFRDAEHLMRTSGGTPVVGKPKATSPMALSLRDLVQEVRTKGAISETGPFVITTTALTARDVARCGVYSLARAPRRVRVLDGGAVEEIRAGVGRGEGCDIVIADTSVSKLHAAIEWHEGYWYLVDQGSTNGTWIGDKRLDASSRFRLRSTFQPFRLGTAGEMAFLVDQEFRDYLSKVVSVVAQAFSEKTKKAVPRAFVPPPPGAAAATARPSPPATDPDEESDVDPFANELPVARIARDAPTRQLSRDLVPKPAGINFPITRRDPPKTTQLSAEALRAAAGQPPPAAPPPARPASAPRPATPPASTPRPAPASPPLPANVRALADALRARWTKGAQARILLQDLSLEIFDSVEPAVEHARRHAAQVQLVEVALPSGESVVVPFDPRA